LRVNKLSAIQGHLPIQPGDAFGLALAPLGDLDQDGVNDLAVGAPGSDDGAVAAGAVWLLFMSPNGDVKRFQRMSATSGGFTGPLDPADNFGSSLAAPGDLDRDGIPDLVVGAPGDDDGFSGAGALWVLFLRRDGTVRGQVKIGAGNGITGLAA